ncbi:MAG TPA: VOC family protein [Chitinophaga sp.]|uniref:VOC family protein n=1 Tax=Chitinophaga sp. TaxID=1869181 RepID=UPI002BEB5936|nr:VOC family protein [Chitinophaga sp.]HVI48675.1 VOC family protein [Chitinophaga sp.]
MKRWKQALLITAMLCLTTGVIYSYHSTARKKVNKMKQKVSIVTIGANNLKGLRNFYANTFGWKPVAENKDIIFFKCNGMLFGIFGRHELARVSGVDSTGSGFRSFTLAYLTQTRAEVDELFAMLKEKGVDITQPPVQWPFGAYAGNFRDIEGNVWEIGYNPLIPLDEEGNVITHENIDHL